MGRKYRLFKTILFFLFIQLLFSISISSCIPALKDDTDFLYSQPDKKVIISDGQSSKDYNKKEDVTIKKESNTPINEKRYSPAYDKIKQNDGMLHYRVLFWVPNKAKKFTPYADNGVNTNVSEHGPVEKWAVVDTGIINGNEKLVFIWVPRTFVFLYGNGFEKVIHLKYN